MKIFCYFVDIWRCIQPAKALLFDGFGDIPFF